MSIISKSDDNTGPQLSPPRYYMLDSKSLLLVGGVVSLATLALRLWNMGKRDKDLPPGPPTVAILGNIPVLPKSQSYLQFTAWSREYGEVYSLKKFNDTIVILSGPRAIYNILEKEGAATMDRPHKYLVQVMSNGLLITMARYGPNWRGGRRAAQEILKPASCAKHLPVQMAESSQLMYDLLTKPDDISTHIERFTFSVITSLMFGVRTPQITSYALNAVFTLVRKFNKLLEPGATPPLEVLPILTYIPERWAWWKREAKELQGELRALLFGLLKDVEEREQAGQGNDCYMEWMLKKAGDFGLTREMVGYVGGSMLGAGSTTTASFLQYFIHLIIEHPEIGAKAREELDRVVGADRLPVLGDFPNLPYLQALVQEVHRFRPVVPLGIPHRAMNDVIYGGYRIPAGTTILTNVYALWRDPAFFDRPEEFNPDRYLNHPMGFKKGVEVSPDDESFKRFNLLDFGFGRRACPGQHLGTNALALNTSRMLWGFEFSDAVKKCDGSPADSTYFSSGASNEPLPFKCKIVPRSPRHAEVIKEALIQATPTLQRFERELSEEDREYVNRIRAECQQDLA